MTTTTNNEEETFLTCSKCNEKMKSPPSNKSPKVLPCLHTFCQSCLESLSTQNEKIIECPSCRSKHTVEINELPFNYSIILFLELSLYSDSLNCDFCDPKSPAEFKCDECNGTLYCKNHLATSHPKRFQNHKIISLNNPQNESNLVSKITVKCNKKGHEKEELKIYCEKCDKFVCQSCFILEHRQSDHIELNIDQAVITYRPKVEELIRTGESKISIIDIATNTINQTFDQTKINSEKVRNDIRKETEELRKRIKQREERLLSECDAKENKFINQLHKLKERKEHIQNANKFVKKTLDLISTDGGESPFLLMKSQIMKRLVELSTIESSQLEPCESDEIELYSYSLSSFCNFVSQNNQSNNNNHKIESLLKLLSEIGEVLNFSSSTPFGSNCVIEGFNNDNNNINRKLMTDIESSIVIKCFNKKGERIIIENNDNQRRFESILPEITFFDNSQNNITHQMNIKASPFIDSNDSGINYRILFTPKSIGNLTLNLKLMNLDIQNSPFTLNIFPKVLFDKSNCSTNVSLSENDLIATKMNGNGSWDGVVLGLFPNPESFRVKILSSGNTNKNSHIYIGLAPKQNLNLNYQNNNRCGWYLYCHNGSPQNSCNSTSNGSYGSKIAEGQIVEVKYNKENRTINFIVDGVDKNISISNVNNEQYDLFPAIEMRFIGESVQFV